MARKTIVCFMYFLQCRVSEPNLQCYVAQFWRVASILCVFAVADAVCTIDAHCDAPLACVENGVDTDCQRALRSSVVFVTSLTIVKLKIFNFLPRTKIFATSSYGCIFSSRDMLIWYHIIFVSRMRVIEVRVVKQWTYYLQFHFYRMRYVQMFKFSITFYFRILVIAQNR